MSYNAKDLSNVIFDDGASPGERANAVTILKRKVNLDRDGIVDKFGAITVEAPKRKRSPPRERPRPQDALRIAELEAQVMKMAASQTEIVRIEAAIAKMTELTKHTPRLVLLFFRWVRGREQMAGVELVIKLVTRWGMYPVYGVLAFVLVCAFYRW